MRTAATLKGIFLFITFTSFVGCMSENTSTPSDKIRRARASLKEGRYYETLSQLSKLDADIHQTAEYHLLHGLSSFKVGDFRGAIASFERASPQSLALQIYLAYLYLLNGDAEQASNLASILESRYDSSSEVLILMGNICLKLSDYHRAKQYFQAALSQDHLAVKAYIGLGNVYIIERDFGRAEEFYIRAIFLSSHESQPYIVTSGFYMALGRYIDAEYLIKTALYQFPNDIQLVLLLSHLYAKTGRNRESIRVIKESIKDYRDFGNLALHMTKRYFQANLLAEAYAMIEELLTKDHHNFYGQILLGEYYLRMNEVDAASDHFFNLTLQYEDSYLVAYYYGLTQLLAGKIYTATQFFRESIKSLPSFTHPHLLLAVIYLTQSKFSLAEDHLELVSLLEPGNINAHILRGITLFFGKHQLEAQYEFAVANRLDPANQIGLFFQGLLALDQHDYENAKRITRSMDFMYIERLSLELALLLLTEKSTALAVLEEYQGNCQNYLQCLILGIFYNNQKSLTKAEDFLKRSLHFEESPIAYYYLANVETSRQNDTAAIAYLQRAIEQRPSYVNAYRALGGLYERVQDHRRAKTIYSKGLTYAPEDSALLNNLGWLELVHLGDKATAYLHLRKAFELAPDDQDIQDSLAWWYVHNHEYGRAISHLEKTVTKHPDNPLFQYHLGIALLKAGERHRAQTHLKMSLELGIADEYRGQILELIR